MQTPNAEGAQKPTELIQPACVRKGGSEAVILELGFEGEAGVPNGRLVGKAASLMKVEVLGEETAD